MSNYTIAEAKQVMAETAAILAEDARRKPDIGTARAAATTDPPSKYEFADEIVRHQEDGATLQEATRLAANARPDLRQAFVERENRRRESGEQQDAEAARRRRNRNR